MAYAGGTLDLYAEKGGDWISEFIKKSKELKNDKEFIISVKNNFFKLYWEKKVADVTDEKKLKKIYKKLPKNIAKLLQGK